MENEQLMRLRRDLECSGMNTYVNKYQISEEYFLDRVQELIKILAEHGVDIESLDDGYHSFADLYEQRMILSAALASALPCAWKSRLHEDGSLPFGREDVFIMGWTTPEGEYTYHYFMDDWDKFKCKELEAAKHFDGHTSKDVHRLLSIFN